MSNHLNKLIKEIQTSIQSTFDINIFLHEDGYGLYRLIGGENMSDAKDLHKNEFNDIKVVNWFDDYWVYAVLVFKKIEPESTLKSNQKGIDKNDYFKKLEKFNLKLGSDFFESFISISVFNGGYDVFSKYQLFRAEWDNYKEGQDKHPQPHWQFYQFEEYKQKLNGIEGETFIVDDDESKFEDILVKKLDFKKFHFAMNGNWINNENHIHSINDNEKIVKWFLGLFSHLRVQLTHVK